MTEKQIIIEGMEHYKPPLIFKNGHISTIYAGLIRSQLMVKDALRMRLTTPDGDFLDIDWYQQKSPNLIVLLHGLEGDSKRPYIQYMIQCFMESGWDAIAINFRGCSGEPNRKLRSYHSGETEDLRFVLNWVNNTPIYQNISLVGFSLGGNVVMKYLGECGEDVPHNLRVGVGFSVPCDLESSNAALSKGISKGYIWRFLGSLKPKALAKANQFPGIIDAESIRKATNLRAFDDAFTAPVHGFYNAKDYWTQSSCLQFLKSIRIPVLLVQAKDDPFLAMECYPFEMANHSKYIQLETPDHGGHVGFPHLFKGGYYWSEMRALAFCQRHIQ